MLDMMYMHTITSNKAPVTNNKVITSQDIHMRLDIIGEWLLLTLLASYLQLSIFLHTQTDINGGLDFVL